MSFDNSRFTFTPWNDFSGVIMQQGRVQLDSDWNEWLAELSRRIQAGTLDILGRAVYPSTTPSAFEITASSSSGTNQISIGVGRMYVDGLLAENHGAIATAVWDPALAEMSGSPQPPPSPGATLDFTAQPYLPGALLPAGNGPFLAYLDVYTRPVLYLQHPALIDKAVGIDTTGRLQTVWQVKLMPVPSGSTWDCSTPDSSIPWAAPSGGRLTTGTVPSTPTGPCCLSTGTGYTGMENQFYRVEIHQPGTTAATFKWSRDNASVATGVTAIASVTDTVGNPASQLTVLDLGRDQVLGFAPGSWIEILDDFLELNGQPGELHQIDTIDFSARTLTLTSPVSAASFPVDANGLTDPTRYTRIRRWDQSGKIYQQDGTTVWADLGAAGSTGDIPVPPAGTTLILESGITVAFNFSASGGPCQTCDYWTFAARTADASVEVLNQAPPRGIHHHYTKLSIVTFSPDTASNCRTSWPSSSSSECGCCCTVTVGDGVESFGKYTSIQKAVDSLPTSGGEVCILPGRYFEYVLILNRHDIVLHGCGWQTRLCSPSVAPPPPPPPAPAPTPAPPSQPANQPPGQPPVQPREQPFFGKASSASGRPISGKIISAPPVPAAPAPGMSAAPAPAATTGTPNTFQAILTIVGSQHIELRDFVVEAEDAEACILVDGLGTLSPAAIAAAANALSPAGAIQGGHPRALTDVNIHDLVLTASTLPSILAVSSRLLRIKSNRIGMKNVHSLWPSVYVSGREVLIDRNWVGILTAANLLDWVPNIVRGDLILDAAASGSAASPGSTKASAYISNAYLHPGGIQIAGPSKDVRVTENEIEGGSRNGITLGNYILLDDTGGDTGQIVGVLITPVDPCATTGSLQGPGTTSSGGKGSRVAAGDRLLEIDISSNRIRSMGLCGIGPVGFFDLVQTLEVITISDLTIGSNTIENTLQMPVAATAAGAPLFGYGAICVPDVQLLIVRDNTILNFGAQPGVNVCGIYILHGEMVEISRNQVLETRDWVLGTNNQDNSDGPRAGIFAAFVMPPSIQSGASAFTGVAVPIYDPGLPALRVEHNVVRVPLSLAFEAVGLGPFSIVNNHFAAGGTVVREGTVPAETVLILNLGSAIESAAPSKFGDLSTTAQGTYSGPANNLSASATGTVLFNGNQCQAEMRSSLERAFGSVLIFTLDHLIYGNNQSWIDGPSRSAGVDAMLLGASLHVTSNRFQESPGSVLASGITMGLLNITSNNISTECLYAFGTLVDKSSNLAIISLFNPQICAY